MEIIDTLWFVVDSLRRNVIVFLIGIVVAIIFVFLEGTEPDYYWVYMFPILICFSSFDVWLLEHDLISMRNYIDKIPFISSASTDAPPFEGKLDEISELNHRMFARFAKNYLTVTQYKEVAWANLIFGVIIIAIVIVDFILRFTGNLRGLWELRSLTLFFALLSLSSAWQRLTRQKKAKVTFADPAGAGAQIRRFDPNRKYITDLPALNLPGLNEIWTDGIDFFAYKLDVLRYSRDELVYYLTQEQAAMVVTNVAVAEAKVGETAVVIEAAALRAATRVLPTVTELETNANNAPVQPPPAIAQPSAAANAAATAARTQYDTQPLADESDIKKAVYEAALAAA